MKVCPLGAVLFYADGQIDGRTCITKVIVVFRNSAKSPKILHFPYCHHVQSDPGSPPVCSLLKKFAWPEAGH
jgi:hypothetical protein